MVCFNNREQYLKAKVLRAWGRSSALYNESEGLKDRFSKDKLNFRYDKKYVFLEFGYNFLPSEISAAFALEQLKKLKNNFKIRVSNFNYLKNMLLENNQFFEIPDQKKYTKTCWLAFPILIKKNSFFTRENLQTFLETNKIQTRAIFSGNVLKQPLMKKKKYIKTPQCDVESNYVMKNGILIGCHHGLKINDLKYIKKTIERFLSIVVKTNNYKKI